jgi:replicative DNA helicase
LHDLLGHHLTALSLNLEVAGHLAQGKAQEHVNQAHTLAKLLLSDVREAVSRLRDDDAIDMAANAYRRDGGLSGLATGFTDLDGRMGGLQPSDLIIVAGRPSMGKTALATNIAYHVARNYRPDADSENALDGAVVGFFSLEMSAEQLICGAQDS